ncbi:MAG: tRNA epoxyqueuosine(34) reductase QueG, partial [Halanaerobiales bacterium]|nr:tRNA epoxyqueuosine(34) reductase QueG [Halanaerobiales bacterium]
GKDYHKVMKNKILEGISLLKEEFSDFKFEYHIDNTPILEKVIASQAGLGWIGKNTTLINKKYGSFLFLGEIFINKKLSYDDPSKNLCKDCSLCIDNCPTDSLQIPYYLNYNRCRSSITQIKGVLNNDQEKLIGNSIWGCDHCQEVCPYNHNNIKDIHSEFKPVIRGDIIDILNYKRKDFPIKWQESALSWKGMRIIHRNALIVLINRSGDGKKYKKVIEEMLKDNSPIIRYYAYKAYLSFDFDQTKVKKLIKSDQELKKMLKNRKWLDAQS